MYEMKIEWALIEGEFVSWPADLDGSLRDSLDDVNTIRKNYPELSAWSDSGLFQAWNAFSQACYFQTWYPTTERQIEFLGYLYECKTNEEGIDDFELDAALSNARKIGLNIARFTSGAN